jgi:hypothetical protein
MKSKRGSCPEVPMGSMAVRRPASSMPLLALPHDGPHTCSDEAGKMGVGRDVDDWLVEGDILLAQDSGQHCPAHSIVFQHRGLEETDQGILDVQPVVHSGPHCTPANQSVFSLSEVKYVKVHTCSCLNSVGNVCKTHRIHFRRFRSRHTTS